MKVRQFLDQFNKICYENGLSMSRIEQFLDQYIIESGPRGENDRAYIRFYRQKSDSGP